MSIQKTLVLNQSLNIPEEIRAEVAEEVDSTFGKMSINQSTWSYLFEVYNRYIAPEKEPQDINCHNCRYTVLSNLRKFVKGWKENNIL